MTIYDFLEARRAILRNMEIDYTSITTVKVPWVVVRLCMYFIPSQGPPGSDDPAHFRVCSSQYWQIWESSSLTTVRVLF